MSIVSRTSDTALYARGPEREALEAQLPLLPVLELTDVQVKDLGLLLSGGFAPLRGFLGRADFERVCSEMRLADGVLWPIPIMLDVTYGVADTLDVGARVALRHPQGLPLAVLTVTDIWEGDRREEATQVFGTDDDHHPGVRHLLHERRPVYVGGRLAGLDPLSHHTFPHLRHRPAELHQRFRDLGVTRVVGFQTRNPLHRAHVALTELAMEQSGAHLLLHPVVGRTSPGDIDYFTRVRSYEALMPHYPHGQATLSLLDVCMRMAGPREALWHALIRKNHGCTHFVVGRSHADPGPDRAGAPYYAPEAAVELATAHQVEAGIEIVAFEEMVHLVHDDRYVPISSVSPSVRAADVQRVSGREFRRLLHEGLDVPEWMASPDVVAALRRAHPPRSHQGFTVFFTGLSGAGKSTVAAVLVAKLMEHGSRSVTLLDGDIVRTHLSQGLGFSKADRDTNVHRIGFVASEITKNGGAVVCAAIAPYAAARDRVREVVSPLGGFVEVHVSTPLEVCEARDVKGLYAKARAGQIRGFTGIDDPYEAPAEPEVAVDTSELTAEEAASRVIEYLHVNGYLA